MPKTPFPHMFPRDVPLFAAYVLSDQSKHIDSWSFDDRVGIPRDPGPTFDPALRQAGIWLSYLRIDATGYAKGIPWLFEVKPEARLSAFGQILAYKHYWLQQREGVPEMAIITDSTNPTMNALYRDHNIHLFLVHPGNDVDVSAARQKVYGRGA